MLEGGWVNVALSFISQIQCKELTRGKTKSRFRHRCDFSGLTLFHDKPRLPCEAPHSLVDPFCWLRPGDCGLTVWCWWLCGLLYPVLLQEAYSGEPAYSNTMSLLMVEVKMGAGCGGVNHLVWCKIVWHYELCQLSFFLRSLKECIFWLAAKPFFKIMQVSFDCRNTVQGPP